MRCGEEGKLRFRTVKKADLINRVDEINNGICSLERKMILQINEMEVAKSLELVVMRVNVK